MFRIEKDNEKIGRYLKERIEDRFESHGKFCKRYLEMAGEPTGQDQQRKMANRLSQILKGKKGIQLYDLPLFCQLLEVSCEDILSAGESCTPTSAHMTNYAVSFSKDEQEWEAYVSREGSPALNADEYGKTFIEYALEAGNYDLLKYLMDKGYIWFVGTDEKDYSSYCAGFGAGSSIEKAIFPYPRNWNVLDAQLMMRDDLRTHMIALAIWNEDIEMLDRLHAREIPSLYQMCIFASVPETCERYYSKKLMGALVCAGDEILEYFSTEFEIVNARFSNKFLFPFLGELIERSLQNKNRFVEYILQDAIQHNRYVYDQLVLLLDEALHYDREDYGEMFESIKSDLIGGILKRLYFYDDGNSVKLYASHPKMKGGFCSNIIQVTAESDDPMIRRRILELNDIYDAIHNLKSHFQGRKNDVIL